MQTLAHPRHAPQLIADLGIVPAHIAARLASYNIRTVDDWHRLGRRRLQLFGVVPSVIAILDRIVRRVA